MVCVMDADPMDLLNSVGPVRGPSLVDLPWTALVWRWGTVVRGEQVLGIVVSLLATVTHPSVTML